MTATALPRIIRDFSARMEIGAESQRHPDRRPLPVPRRVKDFIDISEYTSLDDLVRYLETIRDNLPPEHQAELRIRGDEVFGRRLTITYFREQTPEEVELESKYSAGDENGGSIEELRRQLDDVPFTR